MNRITIFLSLSQLYRREEQLCIMCENLTSLRINEHSFIPLNDIIFYSAPAEETEDDVCLSIGDVHCPHPTHPLSSNQCCGRTVPGEFQVSHGDLEPTTLVTRNFTAQHPFYHSDLSPFSFLALFTPLYLNTVFNHNKITSRSNLLYNTILSLSYCITGRYQSVEPRQSIMATF